MTKQKNLSKSSSEYSVCRSDIRGVDFSDTGSASSKGRAPYMQNLYIDYDSDREHILESVPGFRRVFKFRYKINAMHLQKISEDEEFILLHAEKVLYRIPINERDSISQPMLLGTLKDTRSGGFPLGKDYYILDGERIFRVCDNGSYQIVEDGGPSAPYIPTTYMNYEEYEQRNLLTDKFYEKYEINDLSDVTYGTPELTYAILDREKHTCTVTGIGADAPETVHIPSKVTIGGTAYTVTEIKSHAFRNNTTITKLITNDGLKKIGLNAFLGCSSLRNLVISETVEEISSYAFASCPALTGIYIGAGIKKICPDAFLESNQIVNIWYSADNNSLQLVEGNEAIASKVTYNSPYKPVDIVIKLKTPVSSIRSVTISGASAAYKLQKEGELITGLLMYFTERVGVVGSRFEILCIAAPNLCAKSKAGTSITELCGDTDTSAGKLIKGCTKAVCFDGKVFLAGNSALPNTVFFSSVKRGDGQGLYFGELDYFNDGAGGYGIVSMLPTQDSLAILKSGDDGGGSIFYHKPEDTSSFIRPTKYPVSYIHRGVSCVGDSFAFFDDPVFVSKIGICALDKTNTLPNRNIVCRSHNVNPRLLAENLENARLCEWCGYLVVAVGTSIYLADSRQTFTHECGGREYEWFYLTDIGSPISKNTLFRFHSIPYGPKQYLVYDEPDSAVSTNTLGLAADESYPSKKVYSTYINSKSYHIYPTEEIKPVEIAPCTAVLGTNNLLFLGFENGALCVFNNDKRGVVPISLAENDESFDEQEYSRHFSRQIHPYFYDFDGATVKYALTLSDENCGSQHLTKNTVPGSFTVKCKKFEGSKIKCDVETDREKNADTVGFSTSGLCFCDIDFSSFTFDTSDSITVASTQRHKKWIEKGITLYSDTHHSPMGIHSVNYRYKINGRIKKR